MSEERGEMGLQCQEVVPLQWSRVTTELSDLQQRALYSASEERLRVILALHEFKGELPDEDATIAQELQRLDFKINLILEMVASLVTQQSALMPDVELSLSASRLEWVTDEPPLEGENLRLDLFLNCRYPFPVTLLGCVQSVLPGASKECRVSVELNSLPDELQTLLEKFIFRSHRRQVARMRRKAQQ